MSRLVVVSNRVALQGGPKAATGGLAVALHSALSKAGGIWFGWSGDVGSTTTVRANTVQDDRILFATVDLSQMDYDDYYNGYANSTLWPLFHYRLDLAAFEEQSYSAYQRVNALFSNKLRPLLEPDDIIWVHDYHLIPLGHELRQSGVENRLGFFLHTPFPGPEILTALPAHQQLIRDICTYDVVGFQTENDLRAFLEYIIHEAGGSVSGDHIVQAYGRTFRAQIFPIGIDTDQVAQMALESSKTTLTKQIQSDAEELSWIIGVDRLDYSKGIENRFHAFERLLEEYPVHRGQVTMVQIAPPSRGEVQEYQDIQDAIALAVGQINGRYAEFDWIPINYLAKGYAQDMLMGFYRASRVGLVTPLRDGMNLVAKEYVASQNPHDPGVLVLSRFAGAARELDAALIINPYDTDEMVQALARALDMTLEERQERWESMMDVLRENSLDHWLNSFIDALSKAPYQG